MKRTRLKGLRNLPLALLALMLTSVNAGATSSSTNFGLVEESTPRGGGDAASSSFRLAATLPESAAGPEAVSANFRLNTDLVPFQFQPDDLTPPVIVAGPTVVYVANDRALIEWETDEPADGFVDYGLTPAYGQTAPQATPFSTLHQVLITSLSAGTLHNFSVRSTDPFLNGPTTSANDTFTTLGTADLTPPVVSTPVVTFTAVTAARIEFTTDEAAQTDLQHGPSAALGSATPDPAWRTVHARDLTALPAGADWFYAVDAVDPSGNASAGAVQSFTLPEAVAFATMTLDPALRGRPYASMLQVTGGVGPLAFSLDSGTLPPGLALDPISGEIAGTPTTNGTFNFTIRAADAGTPISQATQPFAISVSTPTTSGKGDKDDDDGCAVSGTTGLDMRLLILLPAAALLRFALRRTRRTA